jgi:hypothetical protein
MMNYYPFVIAAAVLIAIGCAIGMRWIKNEWVRKGLVAFWLIAPPIWFFAEYHAIRADLSAKMDEKKAESTTDEKKKQEELKQLRESQEEKLKNLRESQELASKVWAGVAAVLALIYLKGSLEEVE